MNALEQGRWQDTDWTSVQKHVFQIQKRIYNAAKELDFKAVHKLQKRLLESQDARLLAVRRVTQENSGKRTPGVDGVASVPPGERLEMAKTIRWNDAPSPLLCIPIPKSNGKTRTLMVPTIRDRARQTLVKMSLEP